MSERGSTSLPWTLFAFAATVVLSASLLFTVEPMFARMLLPPFGGSASVWSVAMVFFQGSLLLGYLYAHLITRYLPVRLAVAVHVALLGSGLLLLPLTVSDTEIGGGEAVAVLGVMVASLGVPFLALSANAPLLQAWFLRSGAAGSANPWPLYAASNASSLGALVAYPLVVERVSGLAQQAEIWTLVYGLLIALVALAGFLSRHGGAGAADARAPLPANLVVLWLALAAVPSAGLVAVTAHLSTDVAAAPFLWVVPLALYLLTFVLVFGRFTLAIDAWAGQVLAPVLVVLATLVAFHLRFHLAVDALLHLAGFFLLALACHARLASTRPDPSQLTAFYLVLSAGGVAGGIAAALLAPALFSFVAEYPLTIIAAAVALPKWRLAVAAMLAALVLAGQFLPLDVTSRETRRSFYGVHTIEVTRDGQVRTLRHGLEIHGAQRVAEQGRPTPLTYYHEDSPISEAIDAVRAKRGGVTIRIGVIGLGTGSIACLAEPGDTLDFYEIDPAVVAIARDVRHFRFLDACAPKANILIGDARRSLNASDARYDILIVDAFSSDAIPVHLLTREALQLYRERVGDNGLILLHISNNHLRLQEIVAATATSAGLLMRLNDEDADATAPDFIYQPTVAALAAHEAAFGPLAQSDEWVATAGKTGQMPWTDDRASVLDALLAKLRER